jgi:hypothetical protein
VAGVLRHFKDQDASYASSLLKVWLEPDTLTSPGAWGRSGNMRDGSRQFRRRADDLIEATDRLRDAVVTFKKAFTMQARRIERGTPAVEALESVNASAVRQELASALEEFETLRYKVRVAFIALALDEGSSMSEIARALGVSRQLVSRVAADIEGV